MVETSAALAESLPLARISLELLVLPAHGFGERLKIKGLVLCPIQEAQDQNESDTDNRSDDDTDQPGIRRSVNYASQRC